MSTPEFIRLVLFLTLLVPLGGPVGAQDWHRIADARTHPLTDVLSSTDETPLMTGAFTGCSSLTRCNYTSGIEGAGDEFAGRHRNVALDVGNLLVAGAGFACGPELACDQTTQYCSIVMGGPKGVPPGYSCVDVPDASPRPTCESIPDIGVGCECTEAGGGITVTCTAP